MSDLPQITLPVNNGNQDSNKFSIGMCLFFITAVYQLLLAVYFFSNIICKYVFIKYLLHYIQGTILDVGTISVK